MGIANVRCLISLSQRFTTGASSSDPLADHAVSPPVYVAEQTPPLPCRQTWTGISGGTQVANGEAPRSTAV